MAVARVALGPLKFFASAPVNPPRPRSDRSFFGTLVRVPFFILATWLLIASVAAACFVAFDIPSLLATGRLDHHLPQKMERNFGSPA